MFLTSITSLFLVKFIFRFDSYLSGELKMNKCYYTEKPHTEEQLVNNEDGGFIYCGECGSIIKVTNKEKHDKWFSVE